MYLEIYESPGKTGEVHLNPYEYTYDGTLDRVEKYLEIEPEFGEVLGAPDSMGAPTYEKMTDELSILNEIASALYARGIWNHKIVNE